MIPNKRIPFYTLIILALLIGLFTGRQILFQIASVAFAVIILARTWSWTAVEHIRIMRQTRTYQSPSGQMLDESFIVSNDGWLPKLWLEVEDQSQLPNHASSHVVPFLQIRGKYRWYVKTQCYYRGVYQLGPLSVKSGDPFGLFHAKKQVAATSHILVYPDTFPIYRFRLSSNLLSDDHLTPQPTHFVTANISGVREYVSGDSFNRIHWRTSARKDQLMVKEFDIDTLPDVYLFVDFSTNSLYEAPDVHRLDNVGPIIPGGFVGLPPSTEEYTVTIAASISEYFSRSRRPVGFVAYTPERVHHAISRGEQQLNRIKQTLTYARSLSNYSLAQMLNLELDNFARRNLSLVIITSSTQTDWIARLEVLKYRGVKTTCIVIDPRSFGADKSNASVVSNLRQSRIPTFRVQRGDDLTTLLSERPY